MIANAQSIGISKRELFEDYYPEEIGPIFDEWNVLHEIDTDEDDDTPGDAEQVDTKTFFGVGGYSGA